MNGHCNDDAEILRGLCMGSGPEFLRAVACLERHCKPQVVGWLVQHGIPGHRAEEMWYESLTDAWENLCQKGKPLTTSLCGYLLSIARNKWRHYWRDGKRPVENWDTLPEPPPVEEPEERIPREYIEACREELGQRCRDILDDHDAGLSMEEIAEKYNLTPKSARTTKYRCWQQFTDCIKRKMGLV
jgi:RNA polymerase sigma factor (sigma-70 family)